MPYQNDLSTLAQVVSPVDAAVQAGIQNSQANQEQALANQKAQAVLPFAGPQAQADVENRQAATAQTQAQTQGTNLANMFTQKTQPGKVAATNSENQLKLTSDQASSLSQIGSIAGQVAGMLDGVPAPARPAAMQKILQSYGVSPDKLPQEFLQGDPDMLRNFSQKAIQASADFQTKTAVEAQRQQGALGVAQTTASGRVSAAETAAAARVQAAEIQRQAKQQAQTFEQAAVQAEKAGDHAGAQRFYQAAQNIRQMAAQTTQTLVGVQQPSPGFVDTSGGGGGGAPAGPAPANADATKQAATQAFGSYEPDKYEYGINPKTGNFGRRPK